MSLMTSGHTPAREILRRGSGWSPRHHMLSGGIQVAKKGEFRHTDLGNRHFGVIWGKPGLIIGLKCTLMDAIGWHPAGSISQYHWSEEKTWVWSCPVSGFWSGKMTGDGVTAIREFKDTGVGSPFELKGDKISPEWAPIAWNLDLFLNLVPEHANFGADIFKYRIFDGFTAK